MAIMNSNTRQSVIGITKIFSLAILFGAFVLHSCKPDVLAHTKDVHITIDVQQVSAGFAHVKFATDKKAFYLIGIQPTREGINPDAVAKNFMLLALDSAYLDYLHWRSSHLNNLTPFIADFASHSLHYGEEEHFFPFLESGRDYWVFAFVVDHTKNKPAGELFWTTIQTNDSSTIPVSFHYRIKGRWDYVYPMDSLGNVISYVPWVGETIDSATIVEKGFEKPGHYFYNRFIELYAKVDTRVLYGISVLENTGSHENSSAIKFEEGKTYYTGMAALDAPLVYPLALSVYDIYRFTWQGDSTDLYLTPEQSTNGEWYPPTTSDLHLEE